MRKMKTRALFITFDLSGYYNCIHEELKKHFDSVDFYNLAHYKNLPYKNIFQRIESFYYKKFKKLKLKNYYKYNPVINEIENKSYDFTLIIRPDLFFDKQLKIIRNNSDKMIAYYHDSINNIPRKKDVISFFDKVYSYEKKDVNDYNLAFISNFIYLNESKVRPFRSAKLFTILSKDYRFNTILKLSHYLKKNQVNYQFLVHSDKAQPSNEYVEFIRDRKNNNQVLEYINQCSIIVDVHKYGIQDGLTFRVFESLYFEKKLITTNQDIKTYDFYDKNNIAIIDPKADIDISKDFFDSPYKPIPKEIYQKYLYSNWLKSILNNP